MLHKKKKKKGKSLLVLCAHLASSWDLLLSTFFSFLLAVGMLTPSETSKVLEEINKIDKEFDPEKFLAECQLEIIPTVLEVSTSTSGEFDAIKMES